MRRGLSRVCFTITHGTQVVERAVDNFFRWKKVVTFGEDVLTWAALQRLDSKAEEGEDRRRAQRALRLLQGDVVHKEGENSGSHGLKLETVFEAFCKEHPAWGVGLVTRFKVVPAFQGTEVSFTANALRDEAIGLHAMTLVGHRENDGQHLFLLQNWWKEKQFIEVSAEYLAAARAGITFVGKEVTEIPKEFPTDDNVFCMETEDLAEELEPET